MARIQAVGDDGGWWQGGVHVRPVGEYGATYPVVEINPNGLAQNIGIAPDTWASDAHIEIVNPTPQVVSMLVNEERQGNIGPEPGSAAWWQTLRDLVFKYYRDRENEILSRPLSEQGSQTPRWWQLVEQYKADQATLKSAVPGFWRDFIRAEAKRQWNAPPTLGGMGKSGSPPDSWIEGQGIGLSDDFDRNPPLNVILRESGYSYQGFDPGIGWPLLYPYMTTQEYASFKTNTPQPPRPSTSDLRIPSDYQGRAFFHTAAVNAAGDGVENGTATNDANNEQRDREAEAAAAAAQQTPVSAPAPAPPGGGLSQGRTVGDPDPSRRLPETIAVAFTPPGGQPILLNPLAPAPTVPPVSTTPGAPQTAAVTRAAPAAASGAPTAAAAAVAPSRSTNWWILAALAAALVALGALSRDSSPAAS